MIPAHLIDVDFPAQPQFKFGDCGPRAFGLQKCRSYGDTAPVIPPSEWPELARLAAEAGGGASQLVSRIYDQKSEGSCLPPGTLVRMADGTQKPIEEIKLTDQVVTAQGNIGTVVHLFVRKATGLKRLRLRGHSLLRATAEHPILTQRGYVPIGELTRADNVAMPKYEATGEHFIQTGQFIKVDSRLKRERPVISVEDVEYDGWVYDIEVEGDHSYIADGIAVHNCVANACSQAHEIIQAIQFGKENVTPLSAISLYKRIGSSPSSGAMVNDGLEEMAERGVLPLDNAANRAKYGDAVMPNTGFRTPYPANWEATAKQFRAVEWFIVDTMDELITALFNQHPVVVGRSGHSICYCDPVYQSGSLLVKYANSWGDWGDQGFGYDSLKLIRSSASWAFALRAVTTP
jgi:hypothetical protein